MLAQLAQGGREATEQVYNAHLSTVTGWIAQHGGTADDAADIYQEAMIVLYEKAQHEDFRLTCRIGTYLFAIGKHLWYKRLQQLNRQPGSLPEMNEEEAYQGQAYEDDLNAHHEREAYYEQVDNALDQIGEPCRSLLKAFYHKDMSMQEIAASFGYTNPDNAKTQKYKCLARLRKLFYSTQAK